MLSNSRSFKAFFCRILAVVTVAIVFITAFVFAIEGLGWSADPFLVSSKITDAISEGGSSFPAEWAQNTITGVDTFTDCLTLQISTHKSRKFQESLVSARYEPGNSEHSCTGLIERLAPDRAGSSVADYWRYWWGSASLLATVLNIDRFTLSGYQYSLKVLTYIALGLVGITSLIRFRSNSLIIIPVVLALIFGYGIPIFGQSVAHAPGLLFGLTFCVLYISVDFLHSSSWRRAICAAILGGISFYFDLLNGNIVALLILFLTISIMATSQYKPASRYRAIIETLVLASACVLGAVYLLILRCGLRALVLSLKFSDVMSEWRNALSMRTRNSIPDYNEPYINIIFIGKRLYYKFDYAFAPYLNLLEVAQIYFSGVLVFLVCGIWIAKRFWSVGGLPSGPILSIMFISGIVPVWFLVLANHTAVHSWMTGRLLSPFFSLSLVLLLLLLKDELSTRKSNLMLHPQNRKFRGTSSEPS